MRIIYGVMGYGRGHATRTASVLPELMRRHEVLVLAGRDAYAALSTNFPVTRIPTLGYAYAGRTGKRSTLLTVKQNLPGVMDLFFRGPSLGMVLDIMREFRPDAIISDAEAWTQRAGRRLGVPRIAFDHFGILAHCKPPLTGGDRWLAERDRLTYLSLMGQPQRVIVSSFYDAPVRRSGVRVIGPMLREEVRQRRGTRGDYLLAYFNNGAYQFTDWVELALRRAGYPVKIYGTQRVGQAGNLEFRPPSNLPFLDDLAGCRAVISTAGNQLVGEAMHFGKPLLVMPEACVEQRCNANAIEQLGIGMQIPHRQFSATALEQFLAREEEYQEAIASAARDGNAEALEALEADLQDLAGCRPSKPQFIRKVS